MPKIKFEKTLLVGSGKIAWYQKAERWANRQPNQFVKYFSLGFIAYLKKWWIDVKIENTMRDVDRQAIDILDQWEKDDRERWPHIVEKGVFGDESWSIEISNPIVEGGTSATSTGMVTGSDAQRLQEDEGDKGTS
tara:strand:- start:121 stop:525 length:405 start_codon:yes stop_codon:yes gene_type:complete